MGDGIVETAEAERADIPVHVRRNIFFTWALGLVGVLAMVAVIANGAIQSRKNQIKSSSEIMTALSDLVANNVERTIDGVGHLFSGLEALLETSPEATRPHADLIRWILTKRLEENPHIKDLLVLDETGEIIHWTGQEDPPNVREEAYAAVHYADNPPDFFIGEPQSAGDREIPWTIATSRAVRDGEGAVRWIVAAILRETFFQKEFTDLELPEATTISLVSPKGVIFTRRPDHDAFIAKVVPDIVGFWGMETNSMVHERDTTVTDVVEVASHRRIAGYPLVATVGISRAAVLGPWLRMVWIAAPLTVVAAIAVLFMVFKLAEAQRKQALAALKMKKLRTIDELTGTFTRKRFDNEAEREFKRARRHGDPISIVVVSLDHLRTINREYGNEAGDEALRSTAEALRNWCRASDLLGRASGRSFQIMLPNTDKTGGVALGEKIRKGIEAGAIRYGDDAINITVSVGVSQWSEGEEGLAPVKERATAAAIEAKAQGRNRVHAA